MRMLIRTCVRSRPSLGFARWSRKCSTCRVWLSRPLRTCTSIVYGLRLPGINELWSWSMQSRLRAWQLIERC